MKCLKRERKFYFLTKKANFIILFSSPAHSLFYQRNNNYEEQQILPLLPHRAEKVLLPLRRKASGEKITFAQRKTIKSGKVFLSSQVL